MFIKQTTSFTPWSSYKPRKHHVFGCILISPQNRILTVKGKVTDKWSFPKGHIEGNETGLKCALRELYEETGVVPSSEYVGFKQFKHPTTKKLNTAGYFIFYEPEEYPTHIYDTGEVSEAKWLSWDELHMINGNIDISSFKRWQISCITSSRLLKNHNQNSDLLDQNPTILLDQNTT